MYCKHCGRQIDDDSVYCPYCGTNQESNQSSYRNQTFYDDPYMRSNQYQNTYQEERVGWGWVILGFLSPIVGVILYFVYRYKRPKTAKYCLYSGLISFAFNVLSMFLYY